MSLSNETVTSFDFVIVGGGIAAVACVENLNQLCPNNTVCVISGSPMVKAVSNFTQFGRTLDQFDVNDKAAGEYFKGFRNVTIKITKVEKIIYSKQMVQLSMDDCINYEKLCICTGGIPKMIPGAYGNPRVLGIRDTETVKDFQAKLSNSQRIVIVGNGGIATELVYELKNVDVIWVVRHKSIAATFVDPGAAEFLIQSLDKARPEQGEDVVFTVSKRIHFTRDDASTSNESSNTDVVGSALGPDWVDNIKIGGCSQSNRRVHIEFESEVDRVVPGNSRSYEGPTVSTVDEFSEKDEWPLYVELSRNKCFGCDLVVSATGVTPNVLLWRDEISGEQLPLAEDGGIPVDDQLQTKIENVFAVGDVCTAEWPWAKHWLQMRLWTQARQFGYFAAKSMFASMTKTRAEPDICFDIFTHVTNFFGFKVILLGKFNGQGLSNDRVETLLRCTKGIEFIKVLVMDGRVQGSILIGETDLEETIENLILNEIDISDVKDDLLNPSIDIEDYFD